MSLEDRVALRYFLARQTLAPSFRVLKSLIQKKDFDDAYKALVSFLKTLGIFILSGELHIKTEWLHSLSPSDQLRFKSILDLFASIKDRLGDELALAHQKSESRQRENLFALDKLLDLLEEDLSWIESRMRDESDVITHGPFKIFLTEGAGENLKEAIETLDKAAHLVKGTKFSKVIYGKVYVIKGLRPKGTFSPSPHSGGMIAGSYVAAGDYINLSLYAEPDRDSVMTLIHEFGHRYQARFLDHEKTKLFVEISTEGVAEIISFSRQEREKIADEYIALWREHQNENYPEPNTILKEPKAKSWMENYPREEYREKVIPLLRRFRDEKDISVEEQLREAVGRLDFPGRNFNREVDPDNKKPSYASAYGGTSWQENFAETFLAYVLKKTLPEPLQKFMDEL